MPNRDNVCKCFSSIFSNQLITSIVLLDSCNFTLLHEQILILSDIDLLILLTSLLPENISVVVGWLTKFYMRSFFQGYKGNTCAISFYSVKYICSLCVFYVFFVYTILDSFHSFFTRSGNYIQRGGCIHPLLNLYLLEVLSPFVSVSFDDLFFSSLRLIFLGN